MRPDRNGAGYNIGNAFRAINARGRTLEWVIDSIEGKKQYRSSRRRVGFPRLGGNPHQPVREHCICQIAARHDVRHDAES